MSEFEDSKVWIQGNSTLPWHLQNNEIHIIQEQIRGQYYKVCFSFGKTYEQSLK